MPLSLGLLAVLIVAASGETCSSSSSSASCTRKSREQVLLQASTSSKRDLSPANEGHQKKSTTADTPPACLCVFDVDRTLTGRQEDLYYCPENRIVEEVYDLAYTPGHFTLSELASTGINATFCGGCYLGICTAGDAGGEDSDERRYIADHILSSGPFDELKLNVSEAREWSHGEDVRSPLVYLKPDKTKQYAVEEIRKWYQGHGIDIQPKHVHFFGDRTENIEAFEGMGFNAREVSCSSRDDLHYDMIGYCGAQSDELVDTPGVLRCAQHNVGRCSGSQVRRRRRDGGCYCRRRHSWYCGNTLTGSATISDDI